MPTMTITGWSMRDAPLLAIKLQVEAHLAQKLYIVAYTGFHDTIVAASRHISSRDSPLMT
jgi:hypothetical protein